ncbi:hypothetical protein SAMN05421810_103472 [Amycolatopsis arida]|uniref:Uncharacterized protein n=1 Tax=Amycolatopsis arida TaxID=587909 RepID=A0A1I5TCP0_9PSEU|nr:MafI family immunity protein [Amycolatopsis arida]TDX96149.1 hypothetical protein CLV69_103285 [Amycolatopsis arida]SFP80601.1 hypothetical protein SAMN05421810_103472 [Amycolatopsis arida]
MDYDEFDQRSRELLDRLKGRLSEQRWNEADNYWGHGEWDLLTETVLESLIEDRVRISNPEYALISRMVKHFDPDKFVPFTLKPEEYLGRLVVANDEA